MTAPLIEKLLTGDRRALAQVITTLESTVPADRQRADEVLEAILDRTGNAVRVGITGSPGVGKSTFVNALGLHLIKQGHRLAVLTIDPSSQTTGGSILGDKTRMADLAVAPEAFIRPSPSGGITGGVALRTHEAVLACEAAGFDVVLVETVGVGQSEVAVETITDALLLLVGPGGGDDLQGIKRGIMEMADIVAVNKADGDQKPLAARTAADYEAALSLVRPKIDNRPPSVTTCSALDNIGIAEVWDTVTNLTNFLASSGLLEQKRRRQRLTQLQDEIQRQLMSRARASDAFTSLYEKLADQVGAGTRSVAGATRLLAASLD